MNNAQRESMVFYDSFFEAIKDLPAEEYKRSVNAILMYGLRGEMPETTGIEKTIFVLVKPQIDKNNQRWLNSKKSHAAKKSEKAAPVKAREVFDEPVEENTDEMKKTTVAADDNGEEAFEIDENEMIISSCDGFSEKQEDNVKTADIREAYGEFNNVYLSLNEKKRLIDELGVREFFDRIEFFSAYLMRKPGHKSACHFVDIRDWVGRAVAERKPKEEPKKTALFDFDLEDIYERP